MRSAKGLDGQFTADHDDRDTAVGRFARPVHNQQVAGVDSRIVHTPASRPDEKGRRRMTDQAPVQIQLGFDIILRR